jgi:hypothetical protein
MKFTTTLVAIPFVQAVLASPTSRSDLTVFTPYVLSAAMAFIALIFRTVLERLSVSPSYSDGRVVLPRITSL